MQTMSAGNCPEITNSWVIVGPRDNIEDIDSAAQDIAETEFLQDSDTDSFSIISESGGSYKTDEEEVFSTAKSTVEGVQLNRPEPETIVTEAANEKTEIVEKLYYFATSAACAVILIGLSVAVQQYLQGTSDINRFTNDKSYVNSFVEKVLIPAKRKSNLKSAYLKNKIFKAQKYFENGRYGQVEDNDLTVEAKRNSKYKHKRNKRAALKCNKENCDVNGNRGDEPNTNNVVDCNKKVEELKAKEDYLIEKEKFLIEKEHNLLIKEFKLKDKENQNKNNLDEGDKCKNYCMKENLNQEDDSGKNKNRYYKPLKQEKKREERKIRKTDPGLGSYKMHKYAEDKKKDSTEKRQKAVKDPLKKHKLSGQWYINLHEGRHNIRIKRRSIYKRNKANWYFQRMVDRARLRFK